MKNRLHVLSGIVVMALFPAVAGAVGTYYNGNLYQNPQRKYSRGGYYNSYGYGSGRTYEQSQNMQNVQNSLGNQKQQKQNSKQQNSVKEGFVLNAGLSHQVANWNFNMNNAGSKLHYDDIAWNVFDVSGTYYFDKTIKMQVKAGLQYGKQFGDSPMVDDDITNGGSLVETYYDGDHSQVLGYQTGHALSIGTSKGGSQTGFNVAFGLTDYWTWKSLKITPSFGYRHFKHKLTTEGNYGANIDIFESDYLANCIEVQTGEVQCNPFLLFIGGSGDTTIGQFLRDENGSFVVDSYGNFIIEVPGGSTRLDVGETYYYEQYGTSHSYETTWSGPYVAFDVEYRINNDNMVNGQVELGLPIYHSKGDQPYRYDWAHPTSVEDKGSLGKAYHFGMGANWVTSITDSTTLSLGFTYDYYKVSDADAKTYLNVAFYSEQLEAVNEILSSGTVLTATELTDYQNLQSYLYQLQSSGWTLEDKSEINSVYKSMGMRVGINMKF